MLTTEKVNGKSESDDTQAAEVRRLRRLLACKEEELQALRGELDHYFQAITHELKGPLVALEGFSALLAERVRDSLDDDARGYLERIQSNISHLETLLSSINQMARAEVNGSDMEWFPVNLALTEALMSLQEEIQRSNAKVEVVDALPWAYGHPSAIMQVFRNLLGNAIKYAKPGRRPAVKIGYEGQEIFHKFYVKDNGVGFSPQEREKIFSAFTRLGNKANVRGSGLGLAFVKKIVQAHGGEVWVQARKGRGATFYFTLPRFASVEAAGGGNSDRTSLGSTPREGHS
jgi:signal transduction histidine kinase